MNYADDWPGKRVNSPPDVAAAGQSRGWQPMIELQLTGGDLGQVRFGVSPLSETLQSLGVLHWPDVHPQHRRWVKETKARIRRPDRELLRVLVPPGGPRPSLPVGEADGETTIGQQLQVVADCPAELIRTELELAWRDQPMPAAARRVIAEGAAGVRRLADALDRYWELAVAPYWPGIRAVIEAEIARGARKVADGGVAALLEDLHPHYYVADGAIRVINPYVNWSVDAAGLLLMPSVFAWPHGLVDTGMNGPPSLVYGPRQIGSLWEADRSAGDGDTLKDLLGRSRAATLRSIGTPRSTTELASFLQQSPATINAHLSTLVNCGLATSWRDGRYVLYQRTPLGTRLVATASRSPAQPEE